jgi:hypothetical protein
MHAALRTSAALSLAIVAAVLFSSCSTIRPRSDSRNPPVGRVVGTDEIRRSGATSIWEALSFTVYEFRFQEHQGQPSRIYSSRGQGSMVLREEPLIHLDGTRLGEYNVLRHMPASSALYFQILSGSDGTTYYGTSASAGVILIETTLGVDLEDIGSDSIPPDADMLR